jgi:hypothetical protein
MSRRAAAPVPHDPSRSEVQQRHAGEVHERRHGRTARSRLPNSIIYGAIDRISEKTGKQGGDAIDVLSQSRSTT